MSHQKQREALKSDRKIKDMSTLKIALYLAHKHRVFLLSLSNVTLLTYIIIKTI